jgi:hypothetical protein
MYLIVATAGPDGEPALVEGEGLGITQALVDGLDRDALQPGTPVVMRANPNRGGWGKQVRILDVTTQDGEIHPFYTANPRTLKLTPAESLCSAEPTPFLSVLRCVKSRSAKTMSSCASTIRAISSR